MLSTSVKFCRSYAPFGLKILENTQFSTLFFYMLLQIRLKFYIWLCFTVQIKFECCQFPSFFDGVIPLSEYIILKIHSFLHISLTRCDKLSWNFAYDFVLLYYRLSLSFFLNLRRFLWELCPFRKSEYWKYTVFCTFLLRALTYLDELYIWLCLMYKRSSSSVITLCLSGSPFVHPFSAFSSYIHRHI